MDPSVISRRGGTLRYGRCFYPLLDPHPICLVVQATSEFEGESCPCWEEMEEDEQ